MLKRKRDKEASITSGEQAIMNKETEGLSQGQIVRSRFVRHKGAMTSVFVLSFLIKTIVIQFLKFKTINLFFTNSCNIFSLIHIFIYKYSKYKLILSKYIYLILFNFYFFRAF